MRLLTFDTETTGLPVYGASFTDTDKWPHIIQLSYIIYDTDTGQLTIVNDIIKLDENVDIPEDSIKIHGITREISNTKGIPIIEALTKFRKHVKESHMIIAHNLCFDKQMIMVESGRNNFRHELYKNRNYYCTMKNSRDICKIELVNSKTGEKYYKRPKLCELYKHLFNEEPKNTHNALIDVLICFRCYYKLEKKIDIYETSSEFKELFEQCEI